MPLITASVTLTQAQDAAEHLAEVEEALSTLQSVEVDIGYSEVIAEGVIKTTGGSWIV